MSIDEYRERHRRFFLQQQQQQNGDVSSNIRNISNLISTNTSAVVNIRNSQQNGEKVNSKSNSFSPGCSGESLNSRRYVNRNCESKSCSELNAPSSSSKLSVDRLGEIRNDSTASRRDILSSSSNNDHPDFLYNNDGSSNSHDVHDGSHDARTADELASDALLAQLLHEEMNNHADYNDAKQQQRSHHPGINDYIDEETAAVIAKLVAENEQAALIDEDDGLRVPDTVFQEQLISDHHDESQLLGLPASLGLPTATPTTITTTLTGNNDDHEVARRLQEEEFLKDPISDDA